MLNAQPYLYFGGRCEEALQFYKSAVGAEIDMMMRFNESPEPLPPDSIPDNFGDRILHASFRVGESRIMAADGCTEGSGFEGFALAVTVATDADADRVFNGLADGGNVTLPLDRTFWTSRYGMLTDRFGVNWMVMVGESQGNNSSS